MLRTPSICLRLCRPKMCRASIHSGSTSLTTATSRHIYVTLRLAANNVARTGTHNWAVSNTMISF